MTRDLDIPVSWVLVQAGGDVYLVAREREGFSYLVLHDYDNGSDEWTRPAHLAQAAEVPTLPGEHPRPLGLRESLEVLLWLNREVHRLERTRMSADRLRTALRELLGGDDGR